MDRYPTKIFKIGAYNSLEKNVSYKKGSKVSNRRSVKS